MKKKRSIAARRGVRMKPCLLASLALASCTALAETSPYYIGVSETFSRDSNIFRAPDNQTAISDKWSSTSLLGGIDQPFGRQHFYANGNVRYNRYEDLRILDNTGYSLNTGLDWSTIERLSGSVTYTLNEALAQYAADSSVVLVKKNVEKSQQFAATARLGVVTRMSLDAGFQHRSVDYSADEFAYRDTKQDSVNVGVRYTAGGQLSVGAGLRYTKGSFPHFQRDPVSGDFVSDDFDRKDLDLTADWVPTGLSTLGARLSFSKQTDSLARNRDFSGATGTLTWNYRPTGKLRFTTLLSRDTGTEISYLNLGTGSLLGVGDNSRVSTTARVDAVYDMTAKIQLNGRISQVHRSLIDVFSLSSVGVSSGVSGSDSTNLVNLSVRYVPTRSLLLSCSVAREIRSTSAPLSYPYHSNFASCTAQFVLQ